MSDLVVRFLLGGAIVSLFSVAGELWKPKTFSGIFGAAPSVALGSLALAFSKEGSITVASLARSMVIGSVALFAYGLSCVVASSRENWPVWVAALGAWAVWFLVAFAGQGVGIALGALR